MIERQSDFDLLRRFVRAGDQGAFRDLVRRHVDLVFGTALRKSRDAWAAEEIAQNVFRALARKAWQFAPDDSLPAWLHKTALLESQSWLRGEMRRRSREQTAAEMGTTMNASHEQAAGSALVLILDEGLLSLRDQDRTALLLRYHEGQSLKEVGAALGVSDDTAQKRVASALEKLSQFFQRRGFKTATVAATAGALHATATSASSATVSLVVNGALQAAPPALVGVAALLARLASLTKAQTAVVCLVVTAVPVAWQWDRAHAAEKESGELRVRIEDSRARQEQFAFQIQGLRDEAAAIEIARASAIESQEARAQVRQKLEALRQRIRSLLTETDYHWPEDVPFARIPKSIVSQLNPGPPVRPPGVIEPKACELYGLTQPERELLESELERHFALMDRLMAERMFTTNHASISWLERPHAATNLVFVVPELGSDVSDSVQVLTESAGAVLGEDRAKMLKESLKDHSTYSLRSILGLDMAGHGQEISVWIDQPDGSVPTVGYSVNTAGSGSYSSSGMQLEAFLPGSETPFNDYWDFRTTLHSTELANRVEAWLQAQAILRIPNLPDR